MIELKNVSKTYDTKNGKLLALDNVSIHVPPGQIYGVIGKSGAGKSTLIRCVNLLERPTSGDVLIENESLLKLSPAQLRQHRHKMGMIFQHFNLLDSRTVFENIALPLQLMRKKKSEIKQIIEPLMQLVGLAERSHAYPHQLSGGQKQRVAIARALATEPKILLCDEMTSALDPQTTQSILKLVQDINAKMNLTILLITHEMEVIKRICDRVAVLHLGEVVEEGDVVQIFRSPQHEITRALTQAAFHIGLPPGLQSKVQAKPTEDCITLLRIAFIGDAAGKPIMSELILRFQLQVNILQSNLEMLHNTTIGMMLVAAHASQTHIKAALEYLTSLGLSYEVFGYVPRHDWHFD